MTEEMYGSLSDDDLNKWQSKPQNAIVLSSYEFGAWLFRRDKNKKKQESIILKANEKQFEELKEATRKNPLCAVMAEPKTDICCKWSDEKISKSFIEDVETVKKFLPCGNQMEFPSTFDEFAKDYGFKDKEEVYTNGSELIPVFRVKQWLAHIEQESKADILDKIIADIEQAFCKVENEYDCGRNFGLYMATQIIDKYKEV